MIEAAMAHLNFREGTCRRHRIIFVEKLFDVGIKDWQLMEIARLRFVLEASRRFNDEEMFAYFHTRCVACEHEEWSYTLLDAIIAKLQVYMQGADYTET